jgi:hypothetical protein
MTTPDYLAMAREAQRQFLEQNSSYEETKKLEDVLKGRAVELWSTSTGTFYLVLDEDDAQQAMKRFGASRGEIYTVVEARRIVAVNDPVTVAEIHEWKRRFDGVVRDATRTGTKS